MIRHGAALRVQHRLLLLLLLLLLHFKGVASDKARLLQLENDAQVFAVAVHCTTTSCWFMIHPFSFSYSPESRTTPFSFPFLHTHTHIRNSHTPSLSSVCAGTAPFVLVSPSPTHRTTLTPTRRRADTRRPRIACALRSARRERSPLRSFSSTFDRASEVPSGDFRSQPPRAWMLFGRAHCFPQTMIGASPSSDCARASRPTAP